ncbi:hypothetical protein EDC39_106188 [Geothermobacter ehrlichii]|uniref:Circularly permuted ATP-grasp superfamily protein n=1 Tax=Geothermobacter ehrlichii TaxID=213224 RepID=A0A5D3WIC2_9BACT|nr:hypothetical protein [Geothermobacter ehrlichii]TYO98582.1 hypothetical protein EDC39_106188 [Geothermobacter ehrlichii]
MPIDTSAISPYPAFLTRSRLRQMLRCLRILFRLQTCSAYRRLIEPELPATARFDPGHDAVMMGYDFHLTDDGPRLIEVNTNAGGAMYAYFAAHREQIGKCPPPGPFPRRLLETFWRDWRAFSGGEPPRPRRLVILDEDPPAQHLYPEMECCRALFLREGIDCAIVDPAELQAGAGGVLLDGEPVDFIYNRHCDFYLETPAMAGIREAWLARRVCLSPHPRVYGLLADKRRMVFWSDAAALARTSLTAKERELLLRLVPASRLLADCDPDDVWRRRKELVFKPVARFGGKGVLMGRSTSRKRFAELAPATTLVQQLVPPSMTEGDGESFRTDYRIYAYRDRAIGVAARLYRGQVTNLRTVGGGFARVELAGR